jgi:twitching motility two-component system response regulator PilH
MPKQIHVLVVSDDPLIREEATYGFPSHVRVELGSDAREGMAFMHFTLPAVVVVDIQTGSAGGFSLAREMSQYPEFRDIPIVMLLERDQDRWLAHEAGARLLRLKPIETGDLVAAVLGLARDAA